MGFICFAGLETNGTFLLSGIIDDAMSCVDPKYSTFANEVNRYGMYAALIFAGFRRNEGTPTGSSYGNSKFPRHQYHNRGSKLFPIAGNNSLTFNDKDPMSKDAIADHFNKVAREMIRHCETLRQKCYDIRMKLIASRPKVDDVLTKFFDDIQQIAGKGVGHIYVLNFCQVASLFGFMPMEMVTWASVKSNTSGAYKAITTFYNKNNKDVSVPELSRDEAQKHFDEAVSWISGNVSYQFTPALAENILCELHREQCEDIESPDYKESSKKDVLYMYKHRNSVLHPLYRWKTDLRAKIILQVLMVTKGGRIEGIHDLMTLQRDSIHLTKDEKSWNTSWKGDRYELSPDYCDHLL